MKKFSVSILLLVYFTVSTGFVVNLHYCMGDFAGMEWGYADSKDCGKCGMAVKDKKDCCHDEVKVLKVTPEQAAATFAQFHFGVAKAFLVHAQNPYLFVKIVAQHGAAQAHAPPPVSPQDIYLYNCVLRI